MLDLYICSFLFSIYARSISRQCILGIFWQIDTRLSKLYDNTVKMRAVSSVYQSVFEKSFPRSALPALSFLDY